MRSKAKVWVNTFWTPSSQILNRYTCMPEFMQAISVIIVFWQSVFLLLFIIAPKLMWSLYMLSWTVGKTRRLQNIASPERGFQSGREFMSASGLISGAALRDGPFLAAPALFLANELFVGIPIFYSQMLTAAP